MNHAEKVITVTKVLIDCQDVARRFDAKIDLNNIAQVIVDAIEFELTFEEITELVENAREGNEPPA